MEASELRMRLVEHVERMGEMRNSHQISLRKSQMKNALGRQPGMEDKIKINLKKKYGVRVWTGFQWPG
jgi:hypothetical protein